MFITSARSEMRIDIFASQERSVVDRKTLASKDGMRRVPENSLPIPLLGFRRINGWYPLPYKVVSEQNEDRHVGNITLSIRVYRHHFANNISCKALE
jgi:hypothetical protein